MTEECKDRFLGYLDNIKHKPEKIVLAGDDSVSEILQSAYNCFVKGNGRLCLNGDEFKEVVAMAESICREAKMPVIRGDFINFITEAKNPKQQKIKY